MQQMINPEEEFKRWLRKNLCPHQPELKNCRKPIIKTAWELEENLNKTRR